MAQHVPDMEITMRMKKYAVATAAAFMVLAIVPDARSAGTDGVAVYDATELALYRYTVVKRIWVEDWKSAFSVGGEPDEARARDAVMEEAARVGADGVINLKCLGQTDRLSKPAGYYCYGNAIKLRNEVRVAR
jgi:hypothetical protein